MDSTAISHCSPRTFTSGLISLQNLNAYGSPQWPFSLVLRGVLRGSLAFPLTGPHTFQSYCIPRWFLLSEGSCHGIDLGPHSPINGETSRETTAKLCTPEFGPTSCPSSLRAPGLGCLPLRKAEFTRISPQLPFSSLSQPTRSSPKWPQHPWTSVTCMPPLLLGISTTISLQYPQYLTWDPKKNPLVRILLFQQYHHLFPVSFLPGIYVQWVTRVQPQDFQMKNPTCQNEDNYPPLFPSRPMGKSLQELSFVFSISSQSYFPGAPPYTQLKFRRVGWELPGPSVWNNNKAPFTQSLPGQREGRESPHLAGGWHS